MATVHAGIYNVLKDVAANTFALVGTRIYANMAREKPTTPYVVYHVLSNTSEGNNTEGAGRLGNANVQVDAIDTTALGATSLADAIRADLDGFQGIAGGVSIRVARLTNQTDVPIPPFAGDEVGLRQVSCDFDVLFVY